jgi:hypothetical protein
MFFTQRFFMAHKVIFSFSLCHVFFELTNTDSFFSNLSKAGSSASGWTVFFLLNSLQEVLHSGDTVILPLPTT